MYKLAAILFTCLIFKNVLSAEVSLTGYYKNLLINSKTLMFFPPSESVFLSLNRLRMKIDGSLNDRVSFDFQYDNEIFLGDYLKSNEFSSVIKNQQTDTYVDVESTYRSNSNFFGRHRLYRGYFDIALSDVDLRVGRQRIAWGTAMLWNPMDILNPFNPVQLERQERQGIDAILMDWNYSALSRVSLVYARQRSSENTAARWRGNQKGFDLSLMAGNFRGDRVMGFDFAGQISNIGIRGEITQTNMTKGANYTQGVIGADYTFANKFSVNFEIYYNGQGAANATAYNFNRLLSGEIRSLARRYAGAYFGYDYTPILKWSNYLIANLDDDSLFFAPGILYSLTDNVELSTGVQIFSGDSGTEYGSLENRYYFQFQWFF